MEPMSEASWLGAIPTYITVSHVDWHEFYIVLALLDSYPSNQVARCPDWTVIRKC